MSSRDLRPPDETGTHRGRPFWMWLPDADPPWPAMVILHGAGSRKENHGDFARTCAAAGWASLVYDQRGHGASDDEMSPQALEDVGRMARFLAERDGVDDARVCVRGSSMGGLLAIHAGAVFASLAGVVAICPAAEDDLLDGLRRDTLEMRAGPEARAALAAWLAEHDLRDAVALLGGKPLLLIHAEGDEQIPHQRSTELYERAGDPRKLILLPGGHHRSAQHDAEVHGIALRWMERALARR